MHSAAKPARLVAGLGRGGRPAASLQVSRRPHGSATLVPTRPVRIPDRAGRKPLRVPGSMPNPHRLLICDDDHALRETLTEEIDLYEEFTVVGEASAAGAIARAAEGRIDLVVMDAGLPDLDGREAVRVMRREGFRGPIIMLTAQDSEDDTIEGLEAGANDYVTKPFKFAVLLARIRAQLRQHEASEDAVFQIGPYTFRPGAKLLVDPRGSKLKLTEKETAILRYLYRAGRAVVGRETLLTEVWGYNANVTTHTLETHIYRLRQKIEANPAVAVILITEGGGYKLLP